MATGDPKILLPVGAGTVLRDEDWEVEDPTPVDRPVLQYGLKEIHDFFPLPELACHDGTPYPADRIDEEDSQRRTWLVTRYQPLRETFLTIRQETGGHPIVVVSGYRPEAYQEKLYAQNPEHDGTVASASGSQHPKGRAVDLKHSRLIPRDFHSAILKLYRAGKLPHLGGVGIYPSFVHVDVRPRPSNNHLAQWSGLRTTNQVA